ncbi:MAG TPA: hypothetical protein VF316_09000 [Polyangiaceae bacterium]
MRLTGTRVALLGAVLGLAGATVATDADASVSVAVLFDGLVASSASVDVVTPAEAHAVWEDGRIYTYTRVHVDVAVAGSLAGGSDVWVQTMGGEIGDIGQLVEGEAVLVPGKSSMLFLKPAQSGTFVVTARGQGQFPVRIDPATRVAKVNRNRVAGVLLTPRPGTVARAQALAPSVAVAALPAAEVLDEKSVDDAAKEVRSAWKRTHAP